MNLRQFASITDPLPEPMLLVGADGRIAGLNRAAARQFGAAADTLLDRSLFEFVETPANRVQAYLRECTRTSHFIPGALALRTGDRGTVVYRCDGAHLRPADDGAITEPGPARIMLRLRSKAAASNEFIVLNAKLAELHKEIAERRRAEEQLAALNQCFLGFGRDFDANIERLVEVCGALLNASWVAYESFVDDEVYPMVVWNAPAGVPVVAKYKREGRLCEQVARLSGRELVIWRAAPDDPYARTDPAVVEHRVVTYVGKAVMQEGHIAGCLSVYFQSYVHITQSERRVLEIVTSAIGIETDRRAAELALRRRATELRAMRDDLEEQTAKLRAKGEELELARMAAESANKAKDTFLATMSHEIRTPMNAILGFIEILMTTELTDEQLDYGQTIQSAANALLRIINDVLDFSKLEAGKLEFEAIDFDPRATVGAVAELFARQADAKGLALCVDLDPTLPARLRGDPMRLQQVVANLASNAIKFTQQGRVVISARLESAAEGHVVVRFAVEDTGIGISAQVRERLFHSFTQADTSTTRQYGGTGLGLAICKRLVELMDGVIGVESAPGQGSQFWFTARFSRPTYAAQIAEPGGQPNHLGANSFLPGQGRHAPGVVERMPRKRPAGKPSTRQEVMPDQEFYKDLRVLVVEDNPVNQRLISFQLARLGCAADHASNGRIALEMLASRTYDLIFMDCEMPELDGYEATRQIRQADNQAGLSRIPIIAMTAHALEGVQEQCMEAGMDDYVAKPVSLTQLEQAIARHAPSRVC